MSVHNQHHVTPVLVTELPVSFKTDFFKTLVSPFSNAQTKPNSPYIFVIFSTLSVCPPCLTALTFSKTNRLLITTLIVFILFLFPLDCFFFVVCLVLLKMEVLIVVWTGILVVMADNL